MPTLRIINPATEALIREVETDTPESVQEKVAQARKAQKNWAALSFEQRAQPIRRFQKKLQERKDELAQLLTSEMGKPVSQAAGEIGATDARIRFFLENTPKALETKTVLNETDDSNTIPALQEQISYEPLGVVANISAWNYPYFVGCNVIIPALLTGNAVVYKPSEITTLTGLAIHEMMHEAGVPGDIFTIVIGGGEIGAVLLEQKLDGIFFTGSYATGRKIAAAAAAQLTKVQLELGGKDPVYVCENVDVAKAAEGLADGAFYNAGQSCCAVERIYVHDAIYDDFVAHYTKTVKGFQIGDPTAEGAYIGPLARQPQIKVLEAQLQDAQDKGARVLTGGQAIDGTGYYFEPTVVADVNHEMELMREESFGPVIGIQRVASDEEATMLMNDTAYGLTAGVFTPDRERAKGILAQVSAGSAYWNCCDRVSPRLPWTGRHHSGLGSTLSHIGIETFLQPKGWHLRRS